MAIKTTYFLVYQNNLAFHSDNLNFNIYLKNQVYTYYYSLSFPFKETINCIFSNCYVSESSEYYYFQ